MLFLHIASFLCQHGQVVFHSISFDHVGMSNLLLIPNPKISTLYCKRALQCSCVASSCAGLPISCWVANVSIKGEIERPCGVYGMIVMENWQCLGSVVFGKPRCC